LFSTFFLHVLFTDYIPNWKGKGEINLLTRTLNDGTQETINVLIGSGHNSYSGVTGIAVQSKDKDTTTTMVVVGDETKNAVNWMTTKAVVYVNNDQYLPQDQSMTFHANHERLSITRTDDGYDIETSTSVVRLSTWTEPTSQNHAQRTLFDVTLECKVPNDGSTKGACGNADGDATNDYHGQTNGQRHVSCHLTTTPTLFAPVKTTPYMDGAANDDGGNTCQPGRSTTNTQEAQVVNSPVTEAEMVVAKSCAPGSDLMKQTIAGCATFLPAHFPSDIKNMGDDKLKYVNKCYFVSCEEKMVNKGVEAATRLQESQERRKKCIVPKQERERALAQPPESLAALQMKVNDGNGNGGDVCL
jgi:hypothetical protein|tara:strand:+ start:1300 stop:2373 length:1074 start_codon:yes stop_codon:yes gene_type:complete